MCAYMYGWRHLVKAMEVTAGLAQINGSLPLVGGLKSPVGLYTGISSGPNARQRVWENFTFHITLPHYCKHDVES